MAEFLEEEWLAHGAVDTLGPVTDGGHLRVGHLVGFQAQLRPRTTEYHDDEYLGIDGFP